MGESHSLGILSQVDGFWVYLVVFLLILIQECGVPFPVLPSEVVLLGGGFMASQDRVSLMVAGLLATSATLIGNSVLFLIGRHFGRSALDRYGKYIHLRPDRVDRIEAWVGRSGTPLLIYGPLVPILRAYIPALAGIFGVPFRFYISVLIFAAVVWSFGLLMLGKVLGAHWFTAVTFLRHNLRIAVLLAVLALVIVALIIRWRRKRA
ncbi:MAG TPA: DedA family protein, partial [Chloroflexota bacterium]|nr:DedA family protein [Chloroflexota bacterium]